MIRFRTLSLAVALSCAGAAHAEDLMQIYQEARTSDPTLAGAEATKLATDAIDYSVGFDELAGLGDDVGPGRPLAIVHARSEADAERAAASLRACYTIGEAGPVTRGTVYERVAK